MLLQYLHTINTHIEAWFQPYVRPLPRVTPSGTMIVLRQRSLHMGTLITRHSLHGGSPVKILQNDDLAHVPYALQQ